jgi:hypothetical protein
VTRVAVSRTPGTWSAPTTLASDPEFGGHDVAITPDGSAVAVWVVEPTVEGGLSSVKAATLLPDGTATPVQTLRSTTSIKTCPEVQTNALGQVAALWHEIEESYCGVWGGDLLALRPAGSVLFDAPQVVPGARDAASRGTLGLTDDGRISVTYGGVDGGQLVAGPFGGVLRVTAADGLLAHGTDPGGADILAVAAVDGTGADTVRHAGGGTLSPRAPLATEGIGTHYMLVDEGAGRGAAMYSGAVSGREEWALQVAVDGPAEVTTNGGGEEPPGDDPSTDDPSTDDTSGDDTSTDDTSGDDTSRDDTPGDDTSRRATSGGKPSGGGPVEGAPGGVTSGGGEARHQLPAPAADPFGAFVRAVRVRTRGRHAAVLVDVICTQRCTASARVTLRDRRGRRLRLRAAPRALERSGTLRARLSRRAVHRLRREPHRVTVRLAAASASGARATSIVRR